MKSILENMKIDLSMSVKDLQAKAKEGSKSAKLEIAKRLLTGNGVKKSIETALDILEDISIYEDGEPNYIIGRLYIENIISDPSKTKGVESIQTASAKNYDDATLFLAFSSLHGINNIEKNISVADKNLRKIAIDGNVDAQFEMGRIYEFGIINEVERDIQEAIRWYDMSSKGNNIEAMNRMANIYYYGFDNINKSFVKAIEYWEEYLKIKESDEITLMLANAYAKKSLEILESIENKNEIVLRNKKILSEIK